MDKVMIFYVGAVLFLNGLWILGNVDDKELAIIDFFIGALGVVVALHGALVGGNQMFCAQIFLFAFTYLWVALNRYLNVDGRGLGWFCFFVALCALPWGLIVLSSANSVWTFWLGISWLAWAFLWFLFFLLLALKKETLGKFVGWVTLLEGVFTGWIPGFLLLNGYIG